jgi:hypothetical protein
MAEREALVKGRRWATFLPTLLRVILLQRETWVNPKTDLDHRIEQEFVWLPLIITGNSGHIGPPVSSVPWARDRNVPPRLLKCLSNSE